MSFLNNPDKNEVNNILQTAIDLVGLGIFEIDFHTGEVSLSDMFYKIAKIEKGSTPSTISSYIDKLVHPSYKLKVKDVIKRIQTGEIINSVEYPIICPDGSTCWLRINGQIILSPSGVPIKAFGTVLDITESKDLLVQLEENGSFLETLMQIIPNPIFYKDDKCVYTYCNQAYSDFLGIPMEKIINHGVYDVAPPAYADIYFKADNELMKSQGTQVYSSVMKNAKGKERDVMFHKAVNVNEDGKSLGMVGIIVDITSQKESERQSEKQTKVRDIMLEISRNINTYHTEDDFFNAIMQKLTRFFVNAKSASLMKVSTDDIVTIPYSYNYDESVTNNFVLPLKQSFLWTVSGGKLDRAMIINDIQELIKKSTPDAIPTIDEDVVQSALALPIYLGEKIQYILSLDTTENNVFSDSELALAEYLREQIPVFHEVFMLHKQTLELSRYDSLTNLMNRRYFEAVADDRLLFSTKSNESLSLVIIDIDGLKIVNDTYGHHVGDHYLKEFADLTKRHFRDTDCFARVGGDEFAGLFTKITTEKLKAKFIELQTSFMKSKLRCDKTEFDGRFSFGIATYAEDGFTIKDLFKVADARMYEDKKRIHDEPFVEYKK